MSKIFNERLKEIRAMKGKTQLEVAKAVGVSDRQYQIYEYGKSKPGFDILIALADYFNVPIDYLVGRTDKPKMRL